MKTHSSNFTFQDILRHLAKRTPEENLRFAFSLDNFAKKLYSAELHYIRNKQK